MGALVWGVLQLTASWPGLITLGAAVITGGISYTAALWWLERDLILSLLERIGIARRPQPLPAD
jgi:hypothetical protein